MLRLSQGSDLRMELDRLSLSRSGRLRAIPTASSLAISGSQDWLEYHPTRIWHVEKAAKNVSWLSIRNWTLTHHVRPQLDSVRSEDLDLEYVIEIILFWRSVKVDVTRCFRRESLIGIPKGLHTVSQRDIQEPACGRAFASADQCWRQRSPPPLGESGGKGHLER